MFARGIVAPIAVESLLVEPVGVRKGLSAIDAELVVVSGHVVGNDEINRRFKAVQLVSPGFVECILDSVPERTEHIS